MPPSREPQQVWHSDALSRPTPGIVGTEFRDGTVLFFSINDGLILALYPASDVGRPANGPEGRVASPREADA